MRSVFRDAAWPIGMATVAFIAIYGWLAIESRGHGFLRAMDNARAEAAMRKAEADNAEWFLTHPSR